MKKLFMLTFLTFMIISCGRQGDLEGTNTVLGSALSTNSNEVEEQVGYAKIICNSIRSKRMKAQTSSFEEKLQFKVTRSTCEEPLLQIDDATAHVVLDNNGKVKLIDPANLIEENYLQTDVVGHLTSICSKIANNEQPSFNEYPTPGQVKVIEFTSDSEFYVALGVKESNGQFKLIDKIVYTVNVINTGGSMYGIVLNKSHTSLCKNGQTKIFSREYKTK